MKQAVFFEAADYTGVIQAVYGIKVPVLLTHIRKYQPGFGGKQAAQDERCGNYNYKVFDSSHKPS
jgi:hypothetical protein